MALDRNVSVMGSLATLAAVFAIHQNITPPIADIQGMPAGVADIDVAEKRATWTCIGVVSLVSLLAKDPTIFVVGSVGTFGMSMMTKHANWTEPLTNGRTMTPSEQLSAGSAYTGPEPAEAATQTYEMFDDAGVMA